jgi:hypothetical protein
LLERDEPGKTATLPRPELNPLQHPLLRKNLELWAEIYFGNPPEKRDDAVLQLLHELERREPGASGAHARLDSAVKSPNAQPMVCESCGFVTRPNQRFCGRCGARLITPLADALDQEQQNESATARASSSTANTQQRAFPTLFTGGEQSGAPEEPAQEENSWVGYEEPTPLWRSARLYAGILFALLVGVLGYYAWSGRQSGQSGTNLPQQAPPSAANSVSNPPAQPADQPAKNASDNRSNAPASASRAGEDTRGQNPAENAGEAQTSKAQQAETRDAEAQTPPAASLGNGGEELANAQRLLDSRQGQRDSAQAADWLWKSVAKKNTGAMVTLGQLYLRGDGVPKNCDQAQVLLDAAAKKGSKEAAEMVRNLPAFGCQ